MSQALRTPKPVQATGAERLLERAFPRRKAWWELWLKHLNSVS